MTPDWLQALNRYVSARNRTGELEDAHERHYDPDNFGCSCDECKEYEKQSQEMQRLMNLWGHTWAFRLHEEMKEVSHA